MRLLDAALQRPRASAGGRAAYPSVFAKAAALMHSLILNHPFIDGNKRIGFATAALFLRLNGRRLSVETDDAVEMCLRIARGVIEPAAIAEWLAARGEPEVTRDEGS